MRTSTGSAHLLPGDRRLEADVAGDRARGDLEVEEVVRFLLEVASGHRVERDLGVVGDLAHTDPQLGSDSADPPHQRRLAGERATGVNVGVTDAMADRCIDVGLAGEQVPAHDPAERVAEQDHGPARAGARETDRELEHAQILLQGGVATPTLGEAVPGPIDNERVVAALREGRGEPELASGVVAEAVGDDERRRLGVVAVALEVDSRTAKRMPLVLQPLDLTLEIERGQRLVAPLRLQHQAGRHTQQPLRFLRARQRLAEAKPLPGAHRRRLRFFFLARSRRAL